MLRVFVLSVTLIGLCIGVFAQELPDLGIKKDLAVGVVKATGTEKIVLETKDGMIDAVLQSITQYKRLSPDNLKLSAATESALADIVIGDRVLVTGKVSEDRKSIYANKFFLVKGTDLEEQARKQRQEWQRRGVAGKVTAVDAATKTISIKTKNVIAGDSTIKVTSKDTVKYKRYAEGSARYADAEECDFSAITVGDTFQALGDKSEDGASFAAEEILSGTFITVAGAVKSVDPENNQVTIADLGTKKDVTIMVVKTSILKEFPAEQAQRLARFQMMRRSGAVPAGRAAGSSRGGAGGGRNGGGRRGGGMGDINQMLNRLPTISVGDIKVGDMIAVSSSKPDDPTKVTAIKLLSGVGPFLTSPGGGRSRSGRGVSGGITIPGLDAVDF
jgi:hypothetical protein